MFHEVSSTQTCSDCLIPKFPLGHGVIAQRISRQFYGEFFEFSGARFENRHESNRNPSASSRVGMRCCPTGRLGRRLTQNNDEILDLGLYSRRSEVLFEARHRCAKSILTCLGAVEVAANPPSLIVNRRRASSQPIRRHWVKEFSPIEYA